APDQELDDPEGEHEKRNGARDRRKSIVFRDLRTKAAFRLSRLAHNFARVAAHDAGHRLVGAANFDPTRLLRNEAASIRGALAAEHDPMAGGDIPFGSWQRRASGRAGPCLCDDVIEDPEEARSEREVAHGER